MSTESNKDIARRMFTEPNGLTAHLAEDVRWTIPGTARFCGTYEGKDDLLNRLFKPLGGLLAAVGPFNLQNVIAEGDHVVVQAQGTGRTTTTGKPYNNTYCIVLRIVDGKVAEVHEYCDTELITSAFGAAGANS